MLKLTRRNQLSLLTIFLLAVISYWAWKYEKTHPSTDNAYVQANIVHIASQVQGAVEKVAVQDNQMVSKDQLLFKLDPKPFQLEVNKAQAHLTLIKQQIASDRAAVTIVKQAIIQRTAELGNIHKNYQRMITLSKRQEVARAVLDKITTQYEVAQANLRSAKNKLLQAQLRLGEEQDGKNSHLALARTQLKRAKLQLSYTKVTAPGNGVVSNLTLRPGDVVDVGQALFAIIENNQWWVQANFKETDLTHITTGDPAAITLDLYPDTTFSGVVESISPNSGSTFSLLPPENATGNWVKIVQRFPVRIKIHNNKPKQPLRVGASCSVTVNTNER